MVSGTRVPVVPPMRRWRSQNPVSKQCVSNSGGRYMPHTWCRLSSWSTAFS